MCHSTQTRAPQTWSIPADFFNCDYGGPCNPSWILFPFVVFFPATVYNNNFSLIFTKQDIVGAFLPDSCETAEFLEWWWSLQEKHNVVWWMAWMAQESCYLVDSAMIETWVWKDLFYPSQCFKGSFCSGSGQSWSHAWLFDVFFPEVVALKSLAVALHWMERKKAAALTDTRGKQRPQGFRCTVFCDYMFIFMYHLSIDLHM